MRKPIFMAQAHRRAPLQRHLSARVLLALVMAVTVVSWRASAQEATPEATAAPPVPEASQDDMLFQLPATFDDFQPRQVTSGQGGSLSIFGSGFPTDAAVALEGIGLLPTTFINANALSAALPTSLPPTTDAEGRGGGYRVLIYIAGQPPLECICGGTSATLVVRPAPPTAAPTNVPPTAAPPPTLAPPPTEIPGAPNLLVRNFNANPATVAPGGTVNFTVEIVNVGTRPALGLSVSVDPGGKFIPANGQATILLPDLGVNAATVVGIPVTAAEDTPSGPQTVTITMAYRDFTGSAYTAKGSLTVNVQKAAPRAAQVTLSRYMFDPNPVEPGKEALLTILLTNSGSAAASQVLVRVGDGNILLAGPQGDSFPVGDLAAGASASVEMPLIVSAAAKPGPQPQSLKISYLQEGEAKENTASMTINVAKLVPTSPVLLLDTFETGKTFLQPGEQFTANLTIKNVGEEPAQNMLVTFGTVSPGAPSGSDDNNSGTTTTGTTTPSTTFAPLGSGGTVFAGTIEAGGGFINLTQEFIVSGSVDSGIYTLPITLRYQKADGSAAQETLNASLVVILPPRLNLELQPPLPEQTNIGEPLTLTLKISNRGRKSVNFNSATTAAENGEVVEGAETLLATLRAEDDTSVSAIVIPSEEGPVKITITLNYIDDLNKPQSIVQTYELEAVPAPPPPTFEPPPDSLFPVQGETPQTNPDDLLGRLLLGFLGLGS